MIQSELRLCTASTAHWDALPLPRAGIKTTGLYLQLSFALPGAPSNRVEICELTILLRFSLSSRVRKEEEKTSISTETAFTSRRHTTPEQQAPWKPCHFNTSVHRGPGSLRLTCPRGPQRECQRQAAYSRRGAGS